MSDPRDDPPGPGSKDPAEGNEVPDAGQGAEHTPTPEQAEENAENDPPA